MWDYHNSTIRSHAGDWCIPGTWFVRFRVPDWTGPAWVRILEILENLSVCYS